MLQKNTLQENGSSAAILRYLSMTKFPWKLKYMAKYILEAFFVTTFPSTQKKCPKIYAVIRVLPLKIKRTLSGRFFFIKCIAHRRDIDDRLSKTLWRCGSSREDLFLTISATRQAHRRISQVQASGLLHSFLTTPNRHTTSV